MKNPVRDIGFIFAILMFMAVALVAPAILMRVFSAAYMYTDINALPKTSTGLVLGASVIRGKPSPALEARTQEATLLYKSGKIDTLLASGAVDGKYDEITPMREYMQNSGVPTSSIATDSQGFDTYSSIYRARSVFLADSLIIVSQDFHLPRAVFIARMMHIKAYGIVAPRGGKLYDYIREIPASWKAVIDLLRGRIPTNSTDLAPILVVGAHD